MRPIALADLEFDRVRVDCRSATGFGYSRWLRVGMPRIPDEVIASVFFLYASREDALAGRNPGGTGFVVHTGQNVWTGRGTYYYAITNWHVAVRDGFSVVRLNKPDGAGIEIIELGPEDWEFLPGGPDVAVASIGFEKEAYFHRILSVSIGLFALHPHMGAQKSESPCVGDDVFMLGLFVDHARHATTVPSARFGHISMWPSKEAPIEQPSGYLGESYVVDMHSRTGFSGSPVFVYRTFGSDLTTDKHKVDRLIVDEDVRGVTVEHRTLFKFLGIHWGQFPETWELKDSRRLAESSHLISGDKYIEGMSGMTCVIPSWEIEKVLKMPKLQKLRDATALENPRGSPKVKAESSVPPAKDENPHHQEDFTSLVRAAARKQTRDD